VTVELEPHEERMRFGFIGDPGHGYVVVYDHGQEHYRWKRDDGVYGVIWSDRWDAWRDAREHKRANPRYLQFDP
jgi:hypothetical protein